MLLSDLQVPNKAAILASQAVQVKFSPFLTAKKAMDKFVALPLPLPLLLISNTQSMKLNTLEQQHTSPYSASERENFPKSSFQKLHSVLLSISLAILIWVCAMQVLRCLLKAS